MRVINRIIFALSLFGIVLTLHLWIQKQRGFDQGCLGLSNSASVVATMDECKQVVESEKGKFLGVDNIVWGFLFYVLMGGLTFGILFTKDSHKRWVDRSRLILVTLGFLFTLYLLYLQFFSLKNVCVLCLFSAGIVTSLFGLHILQTVARTKENIKGDPTLLWREIGLYNMIAFLVGALFLADIFFINQIGTESITRGKRAQEIKALAAQVLKSRIDETFLRMFTPCTYDSVTPPIKDYMKLISDDDPFAGNPNSEIVVIELFDPNCPHCKNLHPVMKKVMEKYQEFARFYIKPYPLWGFSVPQIEAIWIAAEEGKYFEMIDLQFRAQRPRGLSFNELVSMAKSLGLDVAKFEKKLKNGYYRDKVLAYRKLVNSVGIHTTPKLLINGRFVGNKNQTLTETCIGHLIKGELKTNSH